MVADLSDVRAEADAFVWRAAGGTGLARLDRVLVAYALAASPTALDSGGLRDLGEQALRAGADEPLLVEVLMLVSAMGVHALHEGVIALNALTGLPDESATAARLRRRREGSTHYWDRLEDELPGFLDGLGRRAPWAYEAFVDFAGAAARHGRLTRLQRELIWAAIDATPSHRYLPGLRLHLQNALRLGVSRAQLSETLELAAAAGGHTGVLRHEGAHG